MHPQRVYFSIGRRKSSLKTGYVTVTFLYPQNFPKRYFRQPRTRGNAKHWSLQPTDTVSAAPSQDSLHTRPDKYCSGIACHEYRNHSRHWRDVVQESISEDEGQG